MAVQNLVFDWDGTLADTYPVISAAYEYTFKQMSMSPIPYDKIKEITSTLPNRDILGYIFNDRRDEAKEHYYSYIEHNHTQKLQAIPQAGEFLDFAAKHKLNLYLLSNKTRKYLLAETDKLGFTHYFRKIVAAGDYSEDKPSPLANFAVFDNQLPSPDSIMVIGDGKADYKVAVSYKSLCAVYNPTNSYDGPQPDYLFKSYQQLTDILQTLI